MNEITIICGRCHAAVAPGSGFLGVSLSEVTRAERAEAAFNAKHPESATLQEVVAELPDEVPWRSRHYACAPKADADAYQIDVDRLRTWADLAHWTAHLLAKTWLTATDWDDILREAAGEIPSRRIRVGEVQAA
jgi:hypothetical protein